MTFEEIKIGDFYLATGGNKQKYMVLDKTGDKARIIIWKPSTKNIHILDQKSEVWKNVGFMYKSSEKLEESGGQFFIKKVFTEDYRGFKIK